MRAGVALAAAGVALCSAPPVPAQHGGRGGGGFNAPPPPLGRDLPGQLLEKPSQPPAFVVPVEALGFSAPAPIYMGRRESLASLDFLDENRLLFTFRVPGLIRREAGDEEERQIRAVVLALPAGTVEAEALWTVHDRVRYLWMLKDGHFLLRDRNNLELGDATLELKPYLRFPEPLLYMEMDPSEELLVTDSTEAAARPEKPGEATGPASAPGGQNPAQHSASLESVATRPGTVLRILRRDSGQVLLVSRTNVAVHLPIDADGYLEGLRGKGDKWLLDMHYFNGGSAIVGQVESIKPPGFDFLSHSEVLATTFPDQGLRKLVAMGTDGRLLWEYLTYRTTLWPLSVRSVDGLRVVWEALAVHPEVGVNTPTLGAEDVKGQLVEVLDAASGKVALDAAASPALDAGGNVAISPSGRRVAVLNGGQIEVFELPPAPPLPDSAAHAPSG